MKKKMKKMGFRDIMKSQEFKVATILHVANYNF